jgi:hypothetical protein
MARYPPPTYKTGSFLGILPTEARYPPPLNISSIFNIDNFDYEIATTGSGGGSTYDINTQISEAYKAENPTYTFMKYLKNITQREIITHLSDFRYGASPYAGISVFSPSIQYMTEPLASWVISDQVYSGINDIDTTADPNQLYIWKEYRQRLLALTLTSEDLILSHGLTVTKIPPTIDNPAGLRTGLTGYVELQRNMGPQFTIIYNMRIYSAIRNFYSHFYMNEFLINGGVNNMNYRRYNSTTQAFSNTNIIQVNIQSIDTNPVFTTGISFDFTNNRYSISSEKTVYELVSGVSTEKYEITRADSMEPISYTTSTITTDLLNINNSLISWGAGTYVATNGTITTLPPITGWNTTAPMLWTFRAGARQNTTDYKDIQLNEIRVYDKYMGYKELSQNVHFIKDSVNRRMLPMTLS